jgi:adenine phosphoribosyltransferase
MNDLKTYIRSVPDYPKPGITFYDITTLLKDRVGFRQAVDRFVWLFVGQRVDKVVGMESRGFMFGPIVAYNLNAGFIPVRKPGKLPASVHRQEYELEYGNDALELHEDAIEDGERVLIVDDLIATGGTAGATAKLVEAAGGEVVGLGFVIELEFLEARERLPQYRIESLIKYSE